jgi:hypothetical protein
MFSLLLSEIMPPSSNAIPIITQYFMCVMLMSAISVIASVMVISLHFRNAKNYTMPLWVRSKTLTIEFFFTNNFRFVNIFVIIWHGYYV